MEKIGFDIGVLYCKAVKLSAEGKTTKSYFEQHHGDTLAAAEKALKELGYTGRERVAFTGAASAPVAEMFGQEPLDLVRCQIRAVNRCCPQARYIIDVGGCSATLVQLDEKGNFQGYAGNSLCAAGTGSFLDEQAGRLGISYQQIGSFGHVENPPTIATRCAVFAKSDLIHRQQEGYSKPEMWSGLCRGMTSTLLGTLLRGRPLDGPTAFIGGVALNREVVRWLKNTYPEFIIVPENPHLLAAVGAALLAEKPALWQQRPASVRAEGERLTRYDWPLSLEKSIYPSFEAQEHYTDDDGNEVRVLKWPADGLLRGWLGIDIGSTSTKLALVAEDDSILVDVYRKTGGDPIGATQKLFKALRALAERRGGHYEILGVGTTGSGRKMVGKVIGADAIVNEISAHVAGAHRVDPSVETIFEIGGQDSKYMHVVDGNIRDANMNYVCAAGTGSFVEEVARKLGYRVDQIGQAVLGRRPPLTSDRCTVFMEQDVGRLIQKGVAPEDALAGVLVSVVKNYLNKVVGNRPRNRQKVFFQGATARNQGLVAAFERVVGCQVVVSPYCHVMGAYGVALLTRAAMKERRQEKSGFLGLDLEKRRISIEKETCRLCQNHCTISLASIDGVAEKPSWGYMCGRDPEEHRVRVNPCEKPLRLRQQLWREGGGGVEVAPDAPVIGLPQALSMYTYYPLWRRFFNRLGFRVELSGATNERIRQLATRLAGADFCFPAKVALGHVAELAGRQGVDFVCVPCMVSEERNPYTTAPKFCPYVQGLPAYSSAALDLNGLDTTRLIAPVVDLRMPFSRQIDYLQQALGEKLDVDRHRIKEAWKDAWQAQRQFEARLRQEGARLLAEASRRGEKVLVLVGRPYNNFDTGMNLGLPQKIAEQGRLVLPMDMLGAEPSLLDQRYYNTYWNYGQKILSALERVAESDNLDAVYLTNFSCGPDSFLLTYAEQIMGRRPFLALELDEHGADAGYLTRVEAFFDVLRKAVYQPRPPVKSSHPVSPRLGGKTVWLPPMHPVGTEIVAAAFRRHGVECRALEPENEESFELGRSLTRGSECLPTALTIGTFIKTLSRENKFDGQVLFMPTAEGPCRFGQYCTLHRQVLDRLGLKQVEILSPSSFNSYQGLDEPMRRTIWKAFLASDALFKAACRVRPYELNPGETNRVLQLQAESVERAFENPRGDWLGALDRALEKIMAVPRSGQPKPLVGVVGEIYVRCNVFANEHVIDAIEKFGGEAWLAPMTEWILYTVATQRISYRDRHMGVIQRLWSEAKNYYILHQEHRVNRLLRRHLPERLEPEIYEVIKDGCQFFPVNFEGEALLTVGRAMQFAKQGASLVVNCAPFGCMPGTLTTAVFRKLSAELGVPVVSMFYDGTGNQNQRLQVFLQNSVRRPEAATTIHLPPAQERPEASLRASNG